LAGATLLAAVLAGCAGSIDRSGVVERMYVIECGENHVKDLSRWTPGSNVGRPYVFSDYCYLIKHADAGWFLWDTGNPDKYASMPNGFSAGPTAPITAYMKKPLVDSLKEIGVDPADIKFMAMSHSHGDHSGNANLFTKALVYMQITEFEALFGADAKKYNLPVANFEFLHTPGEPAGVRTLTGDHDVFGDGSVVIKSTPGHTPGHQSLFVKLRRTGPVLLTGDLAHLYSNWENEIVPGFNYNVEETRQSIKDMKAFAARTHAKVMVNHDKAQNALVVKAPLFLD
jgi:glyoxylase-like metal-dependent hydrolase (beta-lactamase superfamily II)